MSDLLIVKVVEGVNVPSEIMQSWHDKILEMKKEGIVLLPWYLRAELVPENVEIKFEEDLGCQTPDQN